MILAEFANSLETKQKWYWWLILSKADAKLMRSFDTVFKFAFI